jgi:phosphatidylglycerophosphate synthase
MGTGAIHTVKALGMFAVMSTFVVGFVGASHPFPRVGPANQVTLLRLVLVAVVGGLIGETPSARMAWFAVAATIAVAILDGLDGWLARRSRMVSSFGARFDMETDAMLILVLSVLVWQHGKAGLWVIACGMMRYAFVAAGWLLPWMAGPLRSTRRGKTVAIAQLVGLGAALSPLVAASYSVAIAAVTLAALGWSFAIDVAWLSRQYRT